MDETEDGREWRLAARSRRWPLWLGGVVALLLVALAIVWTQRKPIAARFVDRELARRGVEGSYEIESLGLRSQRIRNLVIGNPDDPDLTADWAEIGIGLRFGTPEVTRIDAHGVRLNGRLVDGELHFGQVDRLLPAPSGEPVKLPELDVALSDARLRLATDYGEVELVVNGSGYLPEGFAGKIGGVAPRLAIGGCTASRVRLLADIEIHDRRPSLDGPASAASLSCPDQQLALAAPRVDLDATVDERFERWGGEAGLDFASLSQSANRITRGSGRIEFDGSAALTTGRLALAGADARVADLAARRASIMGHYRLADGGRIVALDGDVRLGGGSFIRDVTADVRDTLRGAAGTPFGPVGNRLADAIQRASARFDGTVSLVVAMAGDRRLVRLSDARLTSASGARLVLQGGDGIRYGPGGALRIETALALAGGGFPDAAVSLRQARAGAPLKGEARIAPIVAGDARLALTPVRFSASRDGRTRIDTRLTVSGPLADGRVDGLTIPVNGILGRGGALAFGAGCVPLQWQRLRVSSLRIGPSRLPLCPLDGGSLFRYVPGRGIEGGARIRGFRLNARLGSSPLQISAGNFRLPLAKPQFAATNVSVRLGSASQVSTLDFDRLSADFVPGGVDGGYAGGRGTLYNVPIALSESDGDWRFVGGALDLDGDGTVTSISEPNPLFKPLMTDDLALHLQNSLITMTAGLHAPENGLLIADVDLHHDLATGQGGAVLDSPRIEFNQTYRLADLTQILTGIVADVEGLVSGRGQLAWDASGVTSTGRYQLTDVDLAASFGPVRGLSTEIEFTDLLGLNTAPHQVARVREINPGVLVTDGRVDYQLLSRNRFAVEGARWPFSGGEIILQPTVLDFGEDQVRRMTFEVSGVDAFQFVNDRDFSSIAATGIFDGELPIVFDANGGRIEGGYLRSRPPGGTFSYEGEISDVNLGVFGTLAFNALELIRYDVMTLTFDGELAGEMLTNIDFTGVTPRIQREGQNILISGLTRRLAEIPIRFDITMRAPFQGLLYSVRLLDDPTFLVTEAIARSRAESTIDETGAEQPVQPTESGIVP